MLRDYQQQAVAATYAAWHEVQNVMMTAPTGSGKGTVIGHILKDRNVPSVVVAHRQELIAQLSLTLNREGVPHSIIAPRSTVKAIVALEMMTHGYTNYSPYSYIRVAAVDTLVRRAAASEGWYDSVEIAIIDEGHHVTNSNKWAVALGKFQNARGLLTTAHAYRGDGLGLGRHADGVVDRLIIGPSGRELIDRGYLLDYDFACPRSDVKIDDSMVGSTGEFVQAKISAAVHASSRIVGDVVKTYLKLAAGKLGISFAVDIESAKEIADKYQSEGVPAQVISGKTPIEVRGALMQQFRNRQILQLVSVDVLGEGVDVPGVEVISMARPTNSFQVFAQQCGRPLRLNITPQQTLTWHALTDAQRKEQIAASIKPKALIIDHVQNAVRNGLPDVKQEYDLGRRDRRSRGGMPDKIPLRECQVCTRPFERSEVKCPYCGWEWETVGRSLPTEVEGDVQLLDPKVLQAWRNELSRIDGPAHAPIAAPAEATTAIMHRHMARQQAQQSLREAMAVFVGYMLHKGYDLREGHKRFYFMFGYDVLTAQTLGVNDAPPLEARIRKYLASENVVEVRE